MKLIVGLGNPGKKYASTKHNVGFMALDLFAQQNNLSFKKDNKFSGEIVKTKDFILLKPHTFMNLSGESIHKVMKFYDIEVNDVLIIYDDLSLPLGKLRLREKGSAGGHNGIKSVISHLHTEEFKRIKVGIDQNPLIETKNYVLSKFSKQELEVIQQAMDSISEIILLYLKDIAFTNIMNQYN
jgi:PTH1 family peptidyl-tRNA hydrolase